MKKINKYKALRLSNLDENLNKNEKLIYNHLILCLDEELGFAYPAYPELMQVINVKRRNSVADTIDSLRKKEYIETKKGFRGTNNYYLLKYITSNENDTSNTFDTSNENNTRTSNKNDTRLVTKPLLNNINNKLNNKVNTNNSKKASNKSNRKIEFNLLINEYTDNENLKEALKDFLKMRELIKSIMSERALKMLFNQLDKLADTDQVKVNILEQSIFNNWKSVYPLRRNQEQLDKEQAIKIDRNVKADSVEDAIRLIRGDANGR
ncbi:hypothetical protein GCM10008904_14320 [Paraclostridium ghonii]|uniref:Helix-turn-helix domain-containing protein n=1 Tax=Paraclostridium ghonii TaxID=29358 RepID=A0ABU0N012_9FIRM|nr:helix-turn-helix domain-containing protein [Paeniclostridium ghonii]MDQ0556451.1 hypothetical protein [Paeniclostridium ghonii]